MEKFDSRKNRERSDGMRWWGWLCPAIVQRWAGEHQKEGREDVWDGRRRCEDEGGEDCWKERLTCSVFLS